MIELMVALSISAVILVTLIGVVASLHDTFTRSLDDAYIRETTQTAYEIIDADIRGCACERSCEPVSSESFESATLAPDDELSRAAKYLSLVVIKRDRLDPETGVRPSDILFLQTTSAGDTEGGLKTSPISRVLYCLCGDNADLSAEATITPGRPYSPAGGTSLFRIAHYSFDSFERLALPGVPPSGESLLIADVAAFEVKVLVDKERGFERRTLVEPNPERERATAVEITITLRDPHSGEERRVKLYFTRRTLDCF